jgi:hypothetical protein
MAELCWSTVLTSSALPSGRASSIVVSVEPSKSPTFSGIIENIYDQLFGRGITLNHLFGRGIIENIYDQNTESVKIVTGLKKGINQICEAYWQAYRIVKNKHFFNKYHLYLPSDLRYYILASTGYNICPDFCARH